MFDELKKILGEPFQITDKNSHRWQIGKYTFAVKPLGNGTFSYNLFNDRGSRGGGWKLTPYRIIDVAKWAIRCDN